MLQMEGGTRGTAWPTPSIRDEHELYEWVGKMVVRESVKLECRMGKVGWQVCGRVVEGLESCHKTLYSSSKDSCVVFVDIWKCVFGEKNRMQKSMYKPTAV